MGSYRQVYYHLVWSTKRRVPAIREDGRDELLRYMWGTLKNKRSHVYRMNAVEDHVHILCDLHPEERLADLIKSVKVASSTWARQRGIFPGWEGWQDAYGAFTKSHSDRDQVIEYIKNQQEHHRHETFLEEWMRLLREAGLEFDPRDLE